MSEALGISAAAIAAAVGACTLVGIGVRYALLPYLREQLRLTRETHTQLTVPGDSPTVRDDLTQIREDVARHSGEIEDAALELRAMALMFDGHLEWASEEAERIRAERQQIVDQIWEELYRQREAGETRTRHYGKHKLEEDE